MVSIKVNFSHSEQTKFFLNLFPCSLAVLLKNLTRFSDTPLLKKGNRRAVLINLFEDLAFLCQKEYSFCWKKFGNQSFRFDFAKSFGDENFLLTKDERKRVFYQSIQSHNRINLSSALAKLKECLN